MAKIIGYYENNINCFIGKIYKYNIFNELTGNTPLNQAKMWQT